MERAAAGGAAACARLARCSSPTQLRRQPHPTTNPIQCSALLAAMEYLEDHLPDWLGEELAGYGDEDYLVIDCPGG